MTASIAIIGGGLSGLYAARLLSAARIDFLLLEARDRLGGRILSVGADGRPAMGPDAFDLGPSWFWPDMQPMMAQLVEALGLTTFSQHAAGDVVFERSPFDPARRYPSQGEMASSFRIAGGTAALVAALVAELPKKSIRLNVRVTQAALRNDGVTLQLRDGEGKETSIATGHVIFALPPRLLESSIAFEPPLGPQTRTRWQSTPTWMAPHAKFLAIYERPFWRDQGLSGTAQSMAGPCTEIHDASAWMGGAALFGFLGVPAVARQRVGEALKDHCLGQLARLFGPEAASPIAMHFKDWAVDGLTATHEDRDASAGHPIPGAEPWFDPVWACRAVMAGSETGRGHPGYLEGALEAANQAVTRLREAR